MARKVWVPVVSGPLAPHAAGFESWLTSRSYSSSASADRLYQFDQLSRWLGREGLGVGELTGDQAERFTAARSGAGLVSWASPQSATLPLEYLRTLGVAPVPAPALAQGPLEELLEDYRRYLSVERGLCDHTVLDAYGPAARLFLAGREGPDGLGLERLRAADVTSFLARECPKRSVSGARDLVCALRSLLRYLHLAGLIETPMVWAVPSVADLRDRTLSRGLEPGAVKKLLASCDRRRLVGRRDFAVLLLLSRLGLRAGEVAGLRLDDVDWRRGELLVRGKGGRHDVLPLPVDVGEAVVSYLRRRPKCGCRELFLRVTAPRQGLTRSTIGWVVRSACDRAGLPRVGAHRLRHTAATGMLRQGASLGEIGQVLRHREQKTTAIYAKGRPDRVGRARAPVAVSGRCGMSMLQESLADYLQIRRRLGFEMPQDGRLLEGFVEFLEQAGSPRITAELALAWARLPVDAHPHRWRQRLSVARGFARHVATLDPTSEIPSTDLLPGHRPRIAPYIYTQEEIAALMAAARQLRPRLRGVRHATLIGLLAVTGMRPGEAIGLDRHDVDLNNGVVAVRAGKQKKQREVPLHATTISALRDYARQRDACIPEPSTPAFFVSARGHRMGREELNCTFTKLIGEVGLEGRGARARPRPHDLRHAFAVHTLLGWYRDGENIDRRMPLLSTYLGHVDPASTYWYLEAVPELLELVSRRLEGLFEVVS